MFFARKKVCETVTTIHDGLNPGGRVRPTEPSHPELGGGRGGGNRVDRFGLVGAPEASLVSVISIVAVPTARRPCARRGYVTIFPA